MLKWYIIIAAALFAGYKWRSDSAQQPKVITDPVYVEFRMDLDAGDRTLNAVLFGRMASRQEQDSA